MRPILFITLSFWLVLVNWACQSGSEKPKESPTPDSLAAKVQAAVESEVRDTIIPDTVALARVQGYFAKGKHETLFDDQMDLIGYRTVLQLDFDGDGVEDYFVAETEWIPPAGSGYIMNGKTGRYFEVAGSPEMQEHPLFWWRPSLGEGVEVDVKSIDVNCGDGQKEVMIVHCEGPPYGSYHGYTTQVTILGYDKDSSKAKVIFEELVSDAGINVADTVWDYKTIRYLDFLYNTPECLDSIKVYPGYHSKGDYPACYRGIRRKRGDAEKLFVFNAQQNSFVEVNKPKDNKASSKK